MCLSLAPSANGGLSLVVCIIQVALTFCVLSADWPSLPGREIFSQSQTSTQPHHSMLKCFQHGWHEDDEVAFGCFEVSIW